MNNIWIITAREYLTRVKKRSFILMTLLTPLLIAGFYGIIIWVSIGQSNSVEKQNIVVMDKSMSFEGKIQQPENIRLLFMDEFSIDNLTTSDTVDGLVTVPANYSLDKTLDLRYETMGSLTVNNKSEIERAFRDVMKERKLSAAGLSQETIDHLQASVSLREYKVDEKGSSKSSNIGINTLLGMALAFMIYMFIFLYGVQVMKGVIEEKTSRIVELIVSTVKPFQLMMGKVVGIALVGLTQLSIWILLSSIFIAIVGLAVGFDALQNTDLTSLSANPALQNVDSDVIDAIAAFSNLPLGKIFGTFIFYFLGGYLFYGALFAAIGSAVDSETDTQQFMLPITLPLIFSFGISFSIVVGDPNGVMATWMSIIPISSPVVMMVRMPFDPPGLEIILSMLTLTLSIVGVIWLAGRIYRVGILMYGKKPTYKELAKWLFYKN